MATDPPASSVSGVVSSPMRRDMTYDAAADSSSPTPSAVAIVAIIVTTSSRFERQRPGAGVDEEADAKRQQHQSRLQRAQNPERAHRPPAALPTSWRISLAPPSLFKNALSSCVDPDPIEQLLLELAREPRLLPRPDGLENDVGHVR